MLYCRDSSVVEFHHIVDFSSIGHYDTKHMLALCPTTIVCVRLEELIRRHNIDISKN